VIEKVHGNLTIRLANSLKNDIWERRPKMKTVKVKISFEAYVDADSVDELKRHANHRADWVLNLREYPEIKCVFHGKVEEIEK
jgi:hypothetical protein